MKSKSFWIAAAFFSVYTVWGSTYVAIRFAIETLPPFLMAGTRFIISGAAMAGFALATGSERPAPGHWRSAGIIGALLLLGGNGLVVFAEQSVPSGVASLLIATVPLWMALMGWALKEGPRPGPVTFSGIAIGFFGVWMLVNPSHSKLDPVGAGILLVAAVSWAWGSILSRRLPLPKSQFLAIGMEMLAGGAILLIVGLLMGEAGRFDVSAVSTKSVMALIYLITFGSFIGFSAYIWLLKETSVAKVSSYAYVNPVVAVFLGNVLAGEALSPKLMMASAVILLGVIVIQTAGRFEIKPEA